MKALRQLFTAAALVVLGATSAYAADDITMQDQTAPDVVKGSPSLSIASKAIAAAGLGDMCAKTNLTLFLPTDDALGTLPRGHWDELMRNSDKLAKVVKFWMVSGAQRSGDLHAGELSTLKGKTVAFNVDKTQGELWYGPARVIQRDVIVKNGVVFVTEKVALPARPLGQTSGAPGGSCAPLGFAPICA